MRVRRVGTPDDITNKWHAVVATCDAACFPTDDPYPILGAYWWVVEAGTEVVGYAGLKPLPHGGGYLCRAGVLPKARGKKLQLRLIRIRERAARAAGMSWLCTYTVAHNPASSNNLIRAGYRLYRPTDLWGGEDALYWWKELK